MQCSRCGTDNQEGYKYCMRCGAPLGIVEQPPVFTSQSLPQTPAYPSLPPAAVLPGYPYSGMTQPNASPLNIWGPFAGYGTRRRHQGWLMDGRGDYAPQLSQTVGQKYRDRQIPGATFQQEVLTARGLIVESRPYFILRRGLVSLGLNVSQLGKDLFISLVSYLKPPISNFRVIVLALSTLFWIFTSFALPSLLTGEAENLLTGLQNSLGGGLFGNGSAPAFDPSTLIFLLCVVGTLGLINNLGLLIFVFYSLYKFLIEKDILAGLRVPPNEFNEDDLMAMEKAVEQTVRISLDEIGLDPAELKPTSVLEGRRLI
jgi:hypothetical protein